MIKSWHISFNYCDNILSLIIIPMGKSVFMTGVAIANSMVGSSMIIFPLNFNQYGILINVFFVIFMAAMMSMTCRLLVAHLREDQLDIAQSIKRKLGPKYSNIFGFVSSFTLFLVSSVFFLLAVDIFYDVFLQLFGNIDFPQKVFKLILMVLFAGLNYLKDLKYVLKLAPFAMGALILSTLTLITSIPFNIDNINSSFFEFKELGFKDILTVASINGFAFICHPSISPMVKENNNPKSNHKAVYIGYAITVILYLLVGVLGALAIFGKTPQKKSNIIDYFSGSYQSPLIGFLNFLYLSSISAIFPYVAKNQALELIPQSKKDGISNLWLKASLVFGIAWLIMNTLFIVFDTSPIIVISFISAVTVFYITYFLPIFLTIKKGEYIPVKDQNLQQSLIVTHSDDKSTLPLKNESQSILTEPQQSTVTDPSQISLWVKILYVAVLLYGSIIFVSQIVSLFS